MSKLAFHQPKGGMCTVCAHRSRDCSSLPFASYPVLERDEDLASLHTTVVVRCLEFVRAGRAMPTLDRQE